MTADLDRPLRRDRLYEQVADRILDLILGDQVSPGDRLPSERDLAERLEVSRPVIREAIRALGVRGVVSVRAGSGTYVRELTSRDASSPIDLMLRLRRVENSFDDLHEVRQALEVQIAAHAAMRASADDIEELRRSIDEMANGGDGAVAFIENDMAFHQALARATHNELFVLLLAPITDLLHDFRLVAYHHDPRESLAGGLRHHRRILECIENHDVNSARAAMEQHLAQARAIVVPPRDAAPNSAAADEPAAAPPST